MCDAISCYDRDLIMGKFSAYVQILSAVVASILVNQFVTFLLLDSNHLLDHIFIIICCSFLLLLFFMNIKFSIDAKNHISECYIDDSCSSIMIVNTLAIKKNYNSSDISFIENIGVNKSVLNKVSYLSLKRDNYRIGFCDGREYFINGESEGVNNIVQYFERQVKKRESLISLYIE